MLMCYISIFLEIYHSGNLTYTLAKSFYESKENRHPQIALAKGICL